MFWLSKMKRLEAGAGQYLYDHSAPHPPPTTETRTMEQHLSATSQPPPASHRLTSGGLTIILSTYQQSIGKLSSYVTYSSLPFIFWPTFSILIQIILLFFVNPKSQISQILAEVYLVSPTKIIRTSNFANFIRVLRTEKSSRGGFRNPRL